jgi:hypothetical protein
MKVLKASGRAPELETWKQLFSSLEERIRTHQQVWPYCFEVVFVLLYIFLFGSFIINPHVSFPLFCRVGMAQISHQQNL